MATKMGFCKLKKNYKIFSKKIKNIEFAISKVQKSVKIFN